ncbi:hypothetical protein SM0020_04925 [Sinorhizobium meliloti CCNWSX0020]|uniref:Uncharacterized protein n=1 Tax=Sinorhizobium meliloti CCNWSX0020 TaxID=1107881 RepID=H0FUZ3_RHIML|nr:hypothetical protein SM0020_04925 [Sinorhizobium meliloti CCNWSX0020]PII39078.1 hypothetical protein T190_10955 [Sinorhizobium meliloti CCBAU 01290]
MRGGIYAIFLLVSHGNAEYFKFERDPGELLPRPYLTLVPMAVYIQWYIDRVDRRLFYTHLLSY